MHPQDLITWVLNAHAKTNHIYDDKLQVPYHFHLELVATVGSKFKHLLWYKHDDMFETSYPVKEPWNMESSLLWRDIWDYVVKPACYAHDAIEDARVTYNDIIKRSNSGVADICSAVTNAGYGKNRHERMPAERYSAILDTPFAVFVKLCDRIANVKYSAFWESKMFEMYKKENSHFKEMLYFQEYHDGTCLDEMWNYLDQLFETKF